MKKTKTAWIVKAYTGYKTGWQEIKRFSSPADADLWLCNYIRENFSGAAYLFEYKGRLVMTDESLYLTEHGDGSYEAPYGAPRGEFETWEEVEAFLEQVFDELLEDDMI